MPIEPLDHPLVYGLIAAVGLHVNHPEDLPSPAHELGEVASLRFQQGPGWWSDAFSEESDHLSVERVDFRQLAYGSGEVVDLAWVDDGERQSGRCEPGSNTRLEPTSALENDEGNREAAEAARQILRRLGVPRDTEGLVRAASCSATGLEA